MPDMNQWIGEGNISCDPELRYTFSQKPVTNFTLYVDSRYKNRNKQDESEPTYLKKTSKVPIVAWAGKAEYIVNNYTKGDKVRLVGHLKSKEFELEDGRKILTFEIVAKNISLIARPNRIPD